MILIRLEECFKKEEIMKDPNRSYHPLKIGKSDIEMIDRTSPPLPGIAGTDSGNTLAVIENRRPEESDELESALTWVEVVLHYIQQYTKISSQKDATNFLLNVVQ